MRDANGPPDGNPCNGHSRNGHILSVPNSVAADRDRAANYRSLARQCIRDTDRDGQPDPTSGMHAHSATNEGTTNRDADRSDGRAVIRRVGRHASSGGLTGNHRTGRHSRAGGSAGVACSGERRGSGIGLSIISDAATIRAATRCRSRVAAATAARLFRPGWQYTELGRWRECAGSSARRRYTGYYDSAWASRASRPTYRSLSWRPCCSRRPRRASGRAAGVCGRPDGCTGAGYHSPHRPPTVGERRGFGAPDRNRVPLRGRIAAHASGARQSRVMCGRAILPPHWTMRR